MPASLYSDENYPLDIVVELRQLGHDILSALEAGQANQAIPDPQVLSFAIALGRALLTEDKDFIKLHTKTPSHHGIVYCSQTQSFSAMAMKIHHMIEANLPLANKLIRVYKPVGP